MRPTVAAALLAVLLSWSMTYSPFTRAESDDQGSRTKTATQIKHLVVIFDQK